MKTIGIILGMFVVTYLPRFLPVLLMDRFVLPVWINRWLKSIPYAALGALIFPGVLSIDKNDPWIGFVGGGVAAVMAFFRLNVIYVIAGAILSVMIAQQWM